MTCLAQELGLHFLYHQISGATVSHTSPDVTPGSCFGLRCSDLLFAGPFASPSREIRALHKPFERRRISSHNPISCLTATGLRVHNMASEETQAESRPRKVPRDRRATQPVTGVWVRSFCGRGKCALVGDGCLPSGFERAWGVACHDRRLWAANPRAPIGSALSCLVELVSVAADLDQSGRPWNLAVDRHDHRVRDVRSSMGCSRIWQTNKASSAGWNVGGSPNLG